MITIKNFLVQLTIFVVFLVFNAWLIQITWNVFFTQYMAAPPLVTIMGGTLIYTLIFHKPDLYLHERLKENPKVGILYLKEGLKADLRVMCVVGLFYLAS